MDFGAPQDDLSFYRNLGLRCGLEVHRQLDTARKLFCHCPVRPYSPSFDAQILRHMRPTLSELGEYDPTALMEFKTRKEIVYRLNRETVCTYEMDDAPPFGLNRDAMYKALKVAVMLNLALVDELHISRKQYLDGSIPTGFQRTTILGIDGYVVWNGKRFGIRQLGLEEDACREVADSGHRRVFMTDRLSIPLIEVVTEPDAHTPMEALGLARTIRKLCHYSGVVRTGMGTARQDVNVSIEGGKRVEIKGVPRVTLIPGLVHYEALRQRALLDLAKEMRRRGLGQDAILELQGLESVVSLKSHPVFTRYIELGYPAAAIVLRQMSGLLGWRLGPSRTFADELSDRVRVVACLDRMPNIEQSDAPGAYALWFEKTREVFGLNEEDAIVVVAGPPEDVKTAIEELRDRVLQALAGVPAETRQVLRTLETGFERVLPGPNRMYPDTDLPAVLVSEADLDRARREAPAPLWEKEEEYRCLGLSQEQIDLLIVLDRHELFDKAVGICKLRPTVLAHLIADELTYLRRKGFPVGQADASLFARLFGGDSAKELTQKEASRLLRQAFDGEQR